MRQVPYLIIGDGRLARHFCHYLQLLDLPFLQWSRRADPTGEQLPIQAAKAERALMCLSDVAIEPFIRQHACLQDCIRIHCSGQLTTDLAIGVHPLMTFTPELYDAELYPTIPFVLEQQAYTFADLFPGLQNPHYTLAAKDKALYHSLCVLSGNFTCILWQKFFGDLESQLGLPKAAAMPYLQQVMKNLQSHPDAALTGPLARGDQTTIAANLAALDGDPFQQIYQAFVGVYESHLLNKHHPSESGVPSDVTTLTECQLELE